MFIGTADGAVIGGAMFAGATVTLHATAIAIVWVVTGDRREPVIICGDVPSDRGWDNGGAIVENLQVPFSAVNAIVGSAADGQALAAARADPEPLAGDFDELSRFADLARPGGVAAMRVVTQRPGEGGNAWDVSPFGLAAAPTLLAPGSGLGVRPSRPGGSVPRARLRLPHHRDGSRRDRDVVDHSPCLGYRLPRFPVGDDAGVVGNRPGAPRGRHAAG